MRAGTEAFGMHGHCIDAMLFEYLQDYNRYDTTTIPNYEQTGWNNAITYIGSNIVCNADFSQWLVDQFHDKETAAKLIQDLSDFIRKDLFTNEKES